MFVEEGIESCDERMQAKKTGDHRRDAGKSGGGFEEQ
jgi:hypothetical protein